MDENASETKFTPIILLNTFEWILFFVVFFGGEFRLNGAVVFSFILYLKWNYLNCFMASFQFGTSEVVQKKCGNVWKRKKCIIKLCAFVPKLTRKTRIHLKKKVKPKGHIIVGLSTVFTAFSTHALTPWLDRSMSGWQEGMRVRNNYWETRQMASHRAASKDAPIITAINSATKS